jgi:hypothetical protein
VAVNKEQVALKVLQTQRKSNFRGSQHAQRESHSFKGSQCSGSCGREDSSKTVKKVSWVEIAMQDAQKQEASRSRVSSKKGQCCYRTVCRKGLRSLSQGLKPA